MPFTSSIVPPRASKSRCQAAYADFFRLFRTSADAWRRGAGGKGCPLSYLKSRLFLLIVAGTPLPYPHGSSRRLTGHSGTIINKGVSPFPVMKPGNSGRTAGGQTHGAA